MHEIYISNLFVVLRAHSFHITELESKVALSVFSVLNLKKKCNVKFVTFAILVMTLDGMVLRVKEITNGFLVKDNTPPKV